MDPSREEVEIPMPLNSAYPGSHVHHGHGHIMPTMFHQHHYDEHAHTHLQSNGPLMMQQPIALNHEVRYRECLKNHAASMGGSVTDGCGEFMPSGEEDSIEALICSVCNCHRNFHRKEVEGEASHSPNLLSPQYPHLMISKGRKVINLGHHKNMLVNGAAVGGYPTATATGGLVSGGGRARPVPIIPYNMGSFMVCSDQSDGQEEGDGASGGVGYMGFPPPPRTATQPSSHHHDQMLKKRFRTKFTPEQKEKLFSFAEKAGWTIQKQEESVVQQFCQEIGVKRKVLKVWMHNNKHNLNKKSPPITTGSG